MSDTLKITEQHYAGKVSSVKVSPGEVVAGVVEVGAISAAGVNASVKLAPGFYTNSGEFNLAKEEKAELRRVVGNFNNAKNVAQKTGAVNAFFKLYGPIKQKCRENRGVAILVAMLKFISDNVEGGDLFLQKLEVSRSTQAKSKTL